MKIINQFVKFLNIAFAIFTFVTLFMVTYNLVATAPNYLVMATKTKVWELYWQIMLFACVTSLSVVVVDLFKKLNPVIARLIKFVFSYAAFALWFFVLSVAAKSGNMTGGAIIVGTGIFVVVYTVIIVLKNLLKFVLTKYFGTEDDSYESLFDGINGREKGKNTKK